MTIEIINTGSELMLGLVLNTHHQWISRQLADAGYTVQRQVSVPDTGIAIRDAVREALARADFIIVTGGLGPTSDDITRDLIAELLGKKLELNAGVVAKLEAYFAQRNRTLPDSAKVQAMVPEGALILDNPNGTAPGLAMQAGKSWVVMLPGPPRELRPMFTSQALPLLKKEFPLADEFICHTLRTTGVGESLIEDKIGPLLKDLIERGLELGYCAHYDGVDVRLIARGKEGCKLVEEAEGIVRQQVGKYIFGSHEETLASVIVRLLAERGESLVLAESCTGGFLANRITDVPGASKVLLCGMVTYSNESKKKLLGVREETLAAYGAVSEATVREMAEGARAAFGATHAIAITGIAGPDGGTAEKPVGTVFIALATKGHTFVLNPVNRLDRPTFKQYTSQQALELLRRQLMKVDV